MKCVIRLMSAKRSAFVLFVVRVWRIVRTTLEKSTAPLQKHTFFRTIDDFQYLVYMRISRNICSNSRAHRYCYYGVVNKRTIRPCRAVFSFPSSRSSYVWCAQNRGQKKFFHVDKFDPDSFSYHHRLDFSPFTLFTTIVDLLYMYTTYMRKRAHTQHRNAKKEIGNRHNKCTAVVLVVVGRQTHRGGSGPDYDGWRSGASAKSRKSTIIDKILHTTFILFNFFLN